MTKKELIKKINNFVKLNPKKAVYPNVNKYNPNSFLAIRNLFKSNLKLVNQDNYNEIFSNKDGKFLSGKQWIKILLASKNLDEYYTNLRHIFIKCNQKLLKDGLSDDLFRFYYRDEKIAIIEATEINFDINTRTKLVKLRNYLEQKEWGIYFFELQKLMHNEIIEFLDWKSDNLNWKEYSKFLRKKISNYLDEEQTNNYFQKIETINLYRNTLTKATIGKGETHQKLFSKWNNLSNIQKNKVSLNLYLDLIDIIATHNLIKNEKVI